MNVSPEPKPFLCGRDDRRYIRYIGSSDLAEALTSAGTLDGDAALGLRFVPPTVVIQPPLHR
jgi:hypothetical protein